MTQPQQHCEHECVCPDYKAAHSENGEEECYGDPEPCKLSCYHRSRPLSEALKQERERVLDEFMQAIEFRFDDTNRGRGVVGTIRGIKESLREEP